MTFVGFLFEKKDEKMFNSFLNNYLKKTVIIPINEKNIYNIRNIRFETIIIDRNIKCEFDMLKRIINSSKYLIINSDKVNMEVFPKMDLTVITYGFGNKCTVTASSVEEENMLICLQRSIVNENNKKIEPQEIQINSNEIQENKYLNMAIETIKLIY